MARRNLPYTYYSAMGRQGGGAYNPFSKHPDWASSIRELLKNMQMMKQMKEEKGQRLWEREQKTKTHDLDRLKANLALKGLSRDIRGEELEVKEKAGRWQKIDEAVKAGTISARDGFLMKMGERPSTLAKPPKPTQHDLKKTYIEGEVAAGRMTQEQGNKELYGIKSKPPPEEALKKGATTRQANANFVRDTFSKAAVGSILKDAKKAKVPPVVNGIRFDMPFAYNVAILNREDRVDTPEDRDAIAKYEAMFKVFQQRLINQGIDTFKKFMTLEETRDLRNDPDFDNGQIKIWYDIYRKY